MWSGEQIYTCRSWLGWYVVCRTDIYMSFMFFVGYPTIKRDRVVIPTTSYVVVFLCCVV